MCPYVAEANIFDLVDAIGNRNGKKAATLLQQKFNEGDDPFRPFPMFIRQLRRLIQVKELADAGLRPADISSTIKQHSFDVDKLHQQCRGFSIAQLEQIMLTYWKAMVFYLAEALFHHLQQAIC